MAPHTPTRSKEMPARPGNFRHIRDWRLGAGVLFALVCFLVPMTALAVASTGRPAGPAIPQESLDRILHARSAPSGPASSRPVARVAVPRTPAGSQFAWLLSQINGGSATLTRSEVQEHVATGFLMMLPANKIVQLLKEATVTDGPVSLTRFAGYSSSPTAIALVETRRHRNLAIAIRVDGTSQHRITGLNVDDLLRAERSR
jgi:hypothetical protein